MPSRAMRGRIMRYSSSDSDRMMPTRMPSWMLGANASVATNVVTAAMPSSRLARQALTMTLKLIRLTTAIMMMAEIIEDRPVFAFDARFNAERENEPLTGMEWQNAAATLASPWPMSSL